MTLAAILAARGIQSALEPAGMHADSIGTLWNVFLGVTVVVYLLVMAVLLAALFRRRRVDESDQSRGALKVITISTAITVLIMFGLLTASIATGRHLAQPMTNPVSIAVTAKQWWWQVDYDFPDKSDRITTANEIVIPAGVPVHIQLMSSDVIHSLWIPNLQGKHDVIPGHNGAIYIRADRPGVYRGQCAEFCGLQHAKMAFWVDVLERDDYARWVAEARKPAQTPSTPSQRKGQEVFMSSPCPLCHNIGGTDAGGRTAPDLTHIASRRSIAAGTLANNRGNLAGWILDPQHIKPGAYMPPMALGEGELNPLLDYLESLK